MKITVEGGLNNEVHFTIDGKKCTKDKIMRMFWELNEQEYLLEEQRKKVEEFRIKFIEQAEKWKRKKSK
jgi:hypothetical protein